MAGICIDCIVNTLCFWVLLISVFCVKFILAAQSSLSRAWSQGCIMTIFDCLLKPSQKRIAPCLAIPCCFYLCKSLPLGVIHFVILLDRLGEGFDYTQMLYLSLWSGRQPALAILLSIIPVHGIAINSIKYLRCSNNYAPTDSIKVEFTDEVFRLCDLAGVWKPSVAFSFYQMAGQDRKLLTEGPVHIVNLYQNRLVYIGIGPNQEQCKHSALCHVTHKFFSTCMALNQTSNVHVEWNHLRWKMAWFYAARRQTIIYI